MPTLPPDQRGEARAKENASARGKLRVLKKRLKQGPAVGDPSSWGRLGRFARRLVMREMQPFVSYQRQLDTAIIDTLQEVTRRQEQMTQSQEQMTRRLMRLREQLREQLREEIQGQLQAQLGALQEMTRRQEQLQGQLDALEAKLSEVVAGIELGSVPVRETLYLGHPFVYPYNSDIGNIIAGGHQRDTILRKVVSELLPKKEPVICEVGSNIGDTLLQILAEKPCARVVAFEPSARFRPFLERNLDLAGFDQVEVSPLLVGREPGSMRLYEYNTTASAVTTHVDGYERHGKPLTEMTTLDEVFRDRGPVDFIKVDTDGFDFEVLRGAKAILKRDRPVLHFEFAPYCLVELAPSEPIEGLTWLQSVGYRRFFCLNPMGELVGVTDDPEQATAWAEANTYCDVLACREGSASEARLESIEFG